MGLFDIFKPKKKTFWEKVGDGLASAGKAAGNYAVQQAKKIKEEKIRWENHYSSYSDEELKRDIYQMRENIGTFSAYSAVRRGVLIRKCKERNIIKQGED
jgi:hypothetical protein